MTWDRLLLPDGPRRSSSWGGNLHMVGWAFRPPGLRAATLPVREARALSGLSQRELAERARTTQSVVGRIEAELATPRVDTVDRLLDAAGYRVVVQLQPIASDDPIVLAYKEDIDRTLLRENLRLSPEERVRGLQALHRLAAEARRAGAELRSRG